MQQQYLEPFPTEFISVRNYLSIKQLYKNYLDSLWKNNRTIIYNQQKNQYMMETTLVLQSFQSQQIELLEGIIENEYQNVEAYNLLAFAIKNHLEKSTDAYMRSLNIMQIALEISPNNTFTLFNIASTYYEMQDFTQAIIYYQKLIQVNKVSDYKAYFNLAMCYEKAGENQQALEMYKQSIRINPNFSSAVINYSNLLMLMSKQALARYTLESYLKNNKGDMRALNNLNIILAEKQKDQEVEENFFKINQSGAVISVFNSGVFLQKQGKLQEALQIFRQIVNNPKEDVVRPLLLLSHVNQGVLFEKLNNFNAAIQKYNYILDNFSKEINSEEFLQRIAVLKQKEKERQKLFPPIIASKVQTQLNSPHQQQQKTQAKLVKQSPDIYKKQQPALVPINNNNNKKQQQPVQVQKNTQKLIQRQPRPHSQKQQRQNQNQQQQLPQQSIRKLGVKNILKQTSLQDYQISSQQQFHRFFNNNIQQNPKVILQIQQEDNEDEHIIINQDDQKDQFQIYQNIDNTQIQGTQKKQQTDQQQQQKNGIVTNQDYIQQSQNNADLKPHPIPLEQSQLIDNNPNNQNNAQQEPINMEENKPQSIDDINKPITTEQQQPAQNQTEKVFCKIQTIKQIEDIPQIKVQSPQSSMEGIQDKNQPEASLDQVDQVVEQEQQQAVGQHQYVEEVRSPNQHVQDQANLLVIQKNNKIVELENNNDQDEQSPQQEQNGSEEQDGISSDGYGLQEPNNEGVYDEILEQPTEVLQVPESQPKTMVYQNSNRLESQPQQELQTQAKLGHSYTQQFAETQKKIAKVIRYPENFEDWTIEDCLRRIEEVPNDIFPVFRLAILYQDDQKEIAKQYLLKVTEMDPLFEAENVNWALGTFFVSEKEWKKALHHFRICYQYSQDRVKSYLEIARCYQNLGEVEKAEKTYKRAIDANNKDYLPYYKLGQMQIKNKQLKEGIDNLSKAQTLDYQNMDIIIKLGEALMIHDEDPTAIDQAVIVLHKGMIVDPLNQECTDALARAYEKKGDLDNAIKYGKLATEQPNSNQNSHYYLGTLYFKKKDLKSAAKSFITLLRINNKHPEALIEYATISSIQGNFEKAKKYLKYALKVSPNNPVANMRLGLIYQTKLQELNSAIECFQQVAIVDPTNYKAYYYMGQCYFQKGELDEGIEYMNQSLKHNQSFGLAWKAVGNIMYEMNQPATALRYFQKAIDLDKNDMEAKIRLGNCYYLQDQFEQAIQIYEEISHLDQNEELEQHMANCYYKKNDFEEAVLHYQRALSINSDKIECYYNLGDTYFTMEKFEEALECFEKVVKNDPQHSAAFYNYANTFFVLEDYENAAKYFEKAIELQPQNVDWRNYVAQLYIKKCDLNQAKRHLDESIRLQPNNPDTLAKYANYYYQIGNYQEALQKAKQTLVLDETNDQAKSLIQELTR
ncbi:unnamed protein product (macronuclear) [Paramecium tetraurelia]|uniref:UDP-N-acetylglucosamine--peptide N-acetylglucosaminyltransferase SPINDLY n=1 Tax=Paramecium tetraurelia TaxID=5888 RepID=A0CVT4_PARTE|nr:uncharacterized protein GSPATT00039062001 [Paramecium tetraurelia]CAK74901.1 unnamed protein product [Paramecium tetraurelia]|eukprot:XP_001442298.1 hypothetical protein (macronuclear) [Paramecium tetraurelia strain d4-2]